MAGIYLRSGETTSSRSNRAAQGLQRHRQERIRRRTSKIGGFCRRPGDPPVSAHLVREPKTARTREPGPPRLDPDRGPWAILSLGRLACLFNERQQLGEYERSHLLDHDPATVITS